MTKEKLNFEFPTLDIEQLSISDIITTSGGKEDFHGDPLRGRVDYSMRID